ncbi:uncharacterized protein YbjT (DUF2867 family) [Saccharothrix coeruleofusca]|uniref:NmrA/HSCARG family protein n=1 Tax=Saccharothrix coeruleofusca TaxID=33919 RepID=UPI001AE842FB|nr:NmrA/HSCARG family protein [Saccharothrix coeruleofusca]MBP2337551.1 uncharacterized protein YbjT (DUF2867 family) [Saccharothrix coeruleofusca]
MSQTDPVLVTGATGTQGGAVARALLAQGSAVRALVRDPAAARAKALEALGADLVAGDLDDSASLVAAATGARAVFSVQTHGVDDPDREVRHGRNLVEAAKAAGVPQFVHTSVYGAGAHRATPGWGEGKWDEHYWESKAHTQDLVREAGFRHWTLLKPAAFMESLTGWTPLFGQWWEGGFVTAMREDTLIPLVAVNDIGTAAAGAFAEPERFHGVELDLAGDLLTVGGIAATLSRALGREIPVLPPDGLDPAIVTLHEWMNVVDTPVRPEHAHALGLPTTDFATWAARDLRMPQA